MSTKNIKFRQRRYLIRYLLFIMLKGSVVMNERIKQYIKYECKNCKNKDTDLCEIRVFNTDGIITTKCAFYERED